ncbi:hypothetical protein FHL15_000768 [Xylaria flabelliformis]|uniref:ABC transporter domain-containing protein n=1 Tax=Xylaria flabelliformis TaxID=2512241 RepID=A0A553ID38_9PEZI|nr:hypothetical protein FHL15_000768 [Xylaria flabelliformis]
MSADNLADQHGDGRDSTNVPISEIICILKQPEGKYGYEILSLNQGEQDGKPSFTLCRSSRASRSDDENKTHDNFMISEPPLHLQPSPQRHIHVVVSTNSGTGLSLQFYNTVLAPLLKAFGLSASDEPERGGAEQGSYHLLITQDADSVKKFARELSSRSRSGEKVEHTIVLLSGDGGIVDLLNSYTSIDSDNVSSKDDIKPQSLPLIAVLPLGTGNALFHSLHRAVEGPAATSDLVQGLRTLLRGKAAPLPSFKAAFPDGSRTITYSDTAESASTESVPKNPTPNLQEQTRYVTHLYGVVVASYGFHSQLVGESDTPSYRQHGAKRFQMVAEELLKESHAYRATVEIVRSSSKGETQRIDRDRHAYILATPVSNLEKTFCISPASRPLDGQLRLVHFGPVDGAKTMEIMMAAYDGGKHVDMRWEATTLEGQGQEEKIDEVGYETIDEIRITTHEEDARWRKVCIDGTIVEIPTGGCIVVNYSAIAQLNGSSQQLNASYAEHIVEYFGADVHRLNIPPNKSPVIHESLDPLPISYHDVHGRRKRHNNLVYLKADKISYRNAQLSLGDSAKAGSKKVAKGKARSEGTEILDNATLRLKAGQRYALVGRNGSGKSTLLKAIAQKLIPGIPEETRIVILQQTDAEDVNTTANPEQTTAQPSNTSLSRGIESTNPLDTVRSLRLIQRERLQKDLFLKAKDAKLRSGARGMQARKALIATEKAVAEFNILYEQKDEEISSETIAKETSEAAEMLADLQLSIEPSKMAEVESRAKKLLSGLGFTEAAMLKPVSSLSGGWRMRSSLAAALLQETDILILDEPTNFLDLLGILWLQQYLTTLGESMDPPTLILVSHDRDFISLCTDLLILRDKSITYFHGDLPTYESAQAEKKIHLTKMKEAQDKQKDHIQQTIQKNMREGKAKDDQNKIRQAKSRQKKLDDRWGLETSARGGRFKLNRDLMGYHLTSRAEIEIPQDERPVNFVLPEPPDLRFPGSLISLDKASYRYPKNPSVKVAPSMVLQDVTLSIHMGDRIGILGLNGSGKSTLIKLLVGETKPSSGTLTLHPRLKIGYYSQHAVEKLQELGVAEPSLTALALLLKETGSTEQEEGHVRGLLGSLGLPGRIASDVPVRKLSGGQLVRLEMARILWTCPHCLVLDEVTTHLDYETVTALREALRDWEGAVIVVSHDRWFSRGVVEGHIDDDGDGSDLSDGERETPRRRLVYRLRAGQMSELTGGVQQFETSLEKRVAKLIGS